MKTDKAAFTSLIARVDEIRATLDRYERQYHPLIEQVHERNRASAVNLVHYLALRDQDLRQLQSQLGELGAAQLGDVEGHVAASLQAVGTVLHALSGQRERNAPPPPPLSIAEGKERLRLNTRALLGEKSGGARTGIMVTMPTEAADDAEFPVRLIKAGMSAARINLGQDEPGVWEGIVRHVKSARETSGKGCRIAMDLGGPKIRTGPMAEGRGVLHLKPDRDAYGRVVRDSLVWLGERDTERADGEKHVFLPVEAAWAARLRPGDRIVFADTRGKSRALHVEEVAPGGVWAECRKSAYVGSGTTLMLKRPELTPSEVTTQVGEVEPVEAQLVLRKGDHLVVTPDHGLGTPAERDQEGNVIRPARIACTLPEVFAHVKVGEPVSFDDGKMHGEVRAVTDAGLEVEITYARGGAARLKPHKGINFPRSQLRVSGLTDKDRRDLRFLVEHGDIVSFSFVNRPSDVDELLAELNGLGSPEIGLILKIETLSGFQHLPEILLRAMRHYPVGVMLARGDLAVEVGWKYLAQVQEEIMSLCAAAHAPLVWATQVLEGLAKKGMPSRAEIADVVMAERAECVMLNKGPHIVATVELLDDILGLMENYHDKRDPLLPSFLLPSEWQNITYVGPGGMRAKATVPSG